MINGVTRDAFPSLSTLISMKKAAGRPQDLIDLDYLNTIRKNNDDETKM